MWHGRIRSISRLGKSSSASVKTLMYWYIAWVTKIHEYHFPFLLLHNSSETHVKFFRTLTPLCPSTDTSASTAPPSVSRGSWRSFWNWTRESFVLKYINKNKITIYTLTFKIGLELSLGGACLNLYLSNFHDKHGKLNCINSEFKTFNLPNAIVTQSR